MAERRGYHHGDLKNALLDAATRLIEAKGVAGLSLRGVAREAGVSQAAPYHHFKDKEALVADVCCLGFQELTERMEAVLQEGPLSLDALDQLGRAYIAFALERRPYFAIMWGGAVDDKEDYPELLASAKCTFEMLVQVIVQGQKEGQIVAGDPVAHGMACWSAVHGAARLIVDKGIDNEGMRAQGVDAEMVVGSTLGMIRRALAV